MQNNKPSIWLLAALLVTGCTTMEAQIQSSGGMGNVDAAYVNAAYDLVQLDNQEGKLAATKARDPRVIDLSSKLVAQAQALQPGLDAALHVEGKQPPTQLSPEVTAMAQKLSTLSGPAFDRQYIADELALHQRVVPILQQEDASTQDGALRTQVETELPAVQANRDSLQILASEFNPARS